MEGRGGKGQGREGGREGGEGRNGGWGGEGRSTWAPPPPRDKLWIRPCDTRILKTVKKIDYHFLWFVEAFLAISEIV